MIDVYIKLMGQAHFLIGLLSLEIGDGTYELTIKRDTKPRSRKPMAVLKISNLKEIFQDPNANHPTVLKIQSRERTCDSVTLSSTLRELFERTVTIIEERASMEQYKLLEKLEKQTKR